MSESNEEVEFFCCECSEPVSEEEHKRNQFYDANNNAMCSQECVDESNFDYAIIGD